MKDAQLNYGITVAEISFVRACVSLFLSCVMLIIYRKNPLKEVEKQDAIPTFIRACSSSAAFITEIKVIELVPLTIIQVITNMTPFVAGLLAFVWLGETLSVN